MSMDYPFLEILHSSEYDDDIHILYDLIKNCQLCWMAYELIEEHYNEQNGKKCLNIFVSSNTILIKSKTHRILARFWFENIRINTPKSYSWAL